MHTEFATDQPAEAATPLEGDALGAVWGRILVRAEEHLRSSEQLAAQLLEGSVDLALREEARQSLDESSAWFADLGMVAAARGARSLRDHLGELDESTGRDVGRAVVAAGLIEGVRSSVETVGGGGMGSGALGDELLVVGQPSQLLDNVIWFAAASGFAVHHREGLEDWPQVVDAMLVVDNSEESLPSALLMCRSARETNSERPLIVVTDRTSTRDRAAMAEYATSLLGASLRTADVVDEVRRHLHAARRPRKLAVRGTDAERYLGGLCRNGMDAWSADNDRDLLAGLETGRASGVLLLPSDDNDAMVRLLRCQPSTRSLTIVEVLEDEQEQVASAGVDATVASVDLIVEQAGQLAELLRQHADLDSDASALTRVGGVPWASATFLAERVLLAAHRSNAVVSICVIRYGTDEQASTVDAVQDALLREFRTDDLVTRSADNENILVLSGVSGAVSHARFQGIVERASTPGSRVGISEFPHDAQSLTELVDAAREGIDRSDAAEGGPRVVAADWHPDRRRAADVIVADSDLAAATVVARSLERMGLSIEHVSDGQELLDRLRDVRIEPPRLLILEFDMLSVDGLTILRRLSNRAALRRFDVVMLSSRSRESDVRQAYDLGALDVIPKPFSPGILIRRLTRLMNGVR